MSMMSFRTSICVSTGLDHGYRLHSLSPKNAFLKTSLKRQISYIIDKTMYTQINIYLILRFQCLVQLKGNNKLNEIYLGNFCIFSYWWKKNIKESLLLSDQNIYIILKLKGRKRQNPEGERKLQKMQMTETLPERSRGQRQIIQKRIKGQLNIMRWRLQSHQLPWIPRPRPVWLFTDFSKCNVYEYLYTFRLLCFCISDTYIYVF